MTEELQVELENNVPGEFGADAFVEMMNANGVDYLFINSGTDTFPIQESIAKYNSQGKITPKVVLCPDESTALAAAHGHFMISKKPQVVLVHVDAGTGQNALQQVDEFHRVVGLTGLTITKLDGTARGGVLIALAERFSLPVHAIGVGEGADDLQPFEAAAVARNLMGLTHSTD